MFFFFSYFTQKLFSFLYIQLFAGSRIFPTDLKVEFSFVILEYYVLFILLDPSQAETLLHSLEGVAAGIGLHVNPHKTEYMCFNQRGNISTLNKCWRQHPTKQQRYGHLRPITKTMQVRRTRHAGHCWRSSDELISDVLLWVPSHGRAKAGRPARIYIQQLCANTGYSLEDLPEAMDDREGCRERVRDIRGF